MRTSSCLLISFVLFLSLQSFSHADLKFIQDTCQKSAQGDPNIHYDFCVTSLQADSNSLSADLQGLGVEATRLALNNATSTKTRIEELLKSSNIDYITKECLESCEDQYSDAIPALTDAVDAYKAKRYNDANIWVSAAMDYSESCEDGFKEKGRASLLTKENDNLVELGAISLAITHMLS